MRTRIHSRRFGNQNGSEPLVGVAQRAMKAQLVREARTALRRANDNLHRVLKPTYFRSIPLDTIYNAVESAGLTINPEERECILVGRQSRAHWSLTYRGIPVRPALWVSWYKMESGRYEVIGAIT